MFGVGMGPTKQETNQYNLLSDIGTFGKNAGENAVTKSNDFWSSIMSGNMDSIMKVLGPQIKAIQGQAQNAKQTASQFGNRGGGTNATMQTVDDTAKGQIDSMISSLTGQAASNLGSSGLSLLSEGTNAGTAAFQAADTMQQQTAAKWGDIFNSISAIIGGAAGFPGIAKTGTGKALTSIAGAI